jgi:polyisoprenoid-binding protein YceI
MKDRIRTILVSLAVMAAGNAAAQQRAIDVSHSKMTVRVFKAGVLSALGHDHTISAPVTGGWVNAKEHSVEVRADAARLRVVDANASGKDRAEIQKTMLGPEVLDSERTPKIEFRSTAAEPSGSGSWTVRGTLSLHGQTRPVTARVSERDGHYVGSSTFRLTEFGIKPTKAAGGTVKVKDEVRIEFDIAVGAHTAPTQ